MSAVVDVAVCCEALFVSDLQRSEEPSTEQVRAAVTTVIVRLGEAGCAGAVAEEFGHHPDCAARRMRWARQAVREAFDCT